MIDEEDGVSNGEWPESRVGNGRPLDCRRQHHGSCDGHDCSDVAFGDAVVVMSTNTGELDHLLKFGERLGEFSRCESL